MVRKQALTIQQKMEAVTETSCLVNVMHEILVDRWRKGAASIAVCPSQFLENTLAYDVSLQSFDKLIGFQFKAYFRDSYKVKAYFRIDPHQHMRLLKYSKNTAFYVFPDYFTHSQMQKDKILEKMGHFYRILNNTWFVEVHEIPACWRIISQSELSSSIIPSYRWTQLSKMINDCLVGFRIVKENKQIILAPDEKSVEEILIPPGAFSFLYTNVANKNVKDVKDGFT